jgi:hypothetical protein
MHEQKFFYECDYCGKKPRLKRNLIKHFRQHVKFDNREKFFCDFCDKTFTSKNGLKMHINEKHIEQNEDHKCKCGKVFETAHRLKKHEHLVHYSEGTNLKCVKCGKISKTLSSYLSHKRFGHKPKIPCKICKKLVLAGYFMNVHLKSHGKKKFQCNFADCSKMFHSKGQMRAHFAYVHVENKVKCSKCKLIFKNEFNLNHHIKVQHKAKDFRCEVEGCQYKAIR